MRKLGILFTDIGGTLGFQDRLNQMHEKERINEKMVNVFDSLTQTIKPVLDVLVADYKIYFDPETNKLLEEIKKFYHLVYVSGARSTTIETIRPAMTIPDAIILENGAIIYSDGYNVDQEWEKLMEKEKAVLNSLRIFLKEKGWILDDEQGRTLMVRIYPHQNPHKTQKEYDNLRFNFIPPPEIKVTENMGGTDFTLVDAGKGNAATYLRSLWGYSAEKTIGIGDDKNDITLLSATAKQFVVRSFDEGREEILTQARENGWYISSAKHFDGINEILRKILQDAQNRK